MSGLDAFYRLYDRKLWLSHIRRAKGDSGNSWSRLWIARSYLSPVVRKWSHLTRRPCAGDVMLYDSGWWEPQWVLPVTFIDWNYREPLETGAQKSIPQEFCSALSIDLTLLPTRQTINVLFLRRLRWLLRQALKMEAWRWNTHHWWITQNHGRF